jgi:hypothetical protein
MNKEQIEIEKQKLNWELEDLARQLAFHKDTIIDILMQIEKVKDRMEELRKSGLVQQSQITL